MRKRRLTKDKLAVVCAFIMGLLLIIVFISSITNTEKSTNGLDTKYSYYYLPGNDTYYVASAFIHGRTQYFTTIEEAVNAVEDGDTIRIEEDLISDKEISINADDNIIINLNGKKIQNTKNEGYAIVVANDRTKTITIQDSQGTGNIQGNNGILVNQGSLTLKAGTVQGNNIGINISGKKPDGCGSVRIEGGTVIGGTYGVMNGYASEDNGRSDLTVTGGTIESGKYGVYSEGSSFASVSTIVTGGVIRGNVGIYNSYGELRLGINDSRISVATPQIIGSNIGVYNEANSVLNFYDGVVKGKSGDYGAIKNEGIINVPESYAIYETTLDGEGYYTAKLEKAEASITKNGGTQYYTLQNAIQAAENGDTIKIEKDVISNEEFTVAKGPTVKITIDLNGKKIENKNTSTGANTFSINSYTTLIITDSSVGQAGVIRGQNGITVESGNVTVEKGTIEGTGGLGINLSGDKPDGCGKATIKGGTVEGKTYGIANWYTSDDNGCSSLVISGGSISGGDYGVYCEGGPVSGAYLTVSTIVTGGVIKGNVGIYNSYGDLTLGIDNAEVLNTPQIYGNNGVGIENLTESSLNFYDGLIMGKGTENKTIHNEGAITKPEGYTIYESTVSDSNGYFTAWLQRTGDSKPVLSRSAWIGDPHDDLWKSPTDEWILEKRINVYVWSSSTNCEYSLDNGTTWSDCVEFETDYYDYLARFELGEGRHEVIVRDKNTGIESDKYYLNIDGTAPAINSTTKSKVGDQQQVGITVIEETSGLKTNDIEYVFSTSTSAPNAGYQKATLNNKQVTITSNVTTSGKYYLYVKGLEDNAGNKGSTVRVGGPYDLTITNPSVAKPTITKQPQAQTKQVGSSVTFSVTATGENLSYQWYKVNSETATGTMITGATNSSYTISSVTTNDSAYYYCIVKNAGGEATSTRAKLTVTNPSVPVTVTKVTLNTFSLTLKEAQVATLTATVQKSDGTTNNNVRWESSDTSVATVQNGRVTGAKAGGPVTIKAISTEDSTKYATCVVTVVEETPTVVNVTGVSLNKEEVTLEEGNIETLNAIIRPTEASDKAVTWSSDNETVATVDENGKITAVREGTANIVVTTHDGGYTAICKVTVTAKTAGGDTPDTPQGGDTPSTPQGGNNSGGGTNNGGTSGGGTTNGSLQGKDGSQATTRIPQTGANSVVLIIAVVVLINGVVMFVRYRKMKY